MIDWEAFSIEQIFTEFEKGKCSNAEVLTLSNNGGLPYIGAKFTDGGVMKFTKKEPQLAMDGDGIIFVNSGDGSGGLAFYKKERFIGSTGISIGRNSKLNKYHFMFIATSICQNAGKYGFGYARTEKRLKRDRILLPAKSGQPDWKYMESYMRKVEQKLLARYWRFSAGFGGGKNVQGSSD
jgi:hypothetical protein